MTRRIALSILLSVWVALLLAGVIAYYVTQQSLIADLDATLLGRIVSLPQIERPGSFSHLTAASDTRDRFIIQTPQGQTIARPSAGQSDVPEPEIINRSFSTLADGSRLRTLQVRAFAHRESPSDPLKPVTITYSGPADRLDALLSRLAISLGIYGLLAGIATSAIAVSVAKAALRPLYATADTLSGINETNLDRRIEIKRLPPELAPVGTRLNDLLARLETAFKLRKQFLADASHELRTPVAALITTLEVTLNKQRSNEDYHRTLDTCLADARLLHQLVATLLDQVRSEQFGTSSGPADLAPVGISRVLNHCCDMAETLAKKKKIQIVRNVPANVTGMTDELKLHSIATNLLSNAVDYTPAEGTVTLSLEVTSLPPGYTNEAMATTAPESSYTVRRMIHLSVTDNGPGVPKDQQAHLFEPFYRADKVRSHGDLHLGLGLFLVKTHARSLAGDCRVESPVRTIGSGCRFIVEYPVAIIENQNEETDNFTVRGGVPSALLAKDSQ